MSRFFVVVLTVSFSAFISHHSFGYGADGHAMVGAIADDRLAGTPAGEAEKKLLDGIPLAQAAVFPDQIKSWDRSLPSASKGFHIAGHPEIEKQLIAFIKANPYRSQDPADHDKAMPPTHHWFHYTDVPVADGETYEQGTTGRSQWDIVHMTDFCLRVLTGQEPEDNPRAITKPVALILLAHYLGDIHQPLHVGAEYFSKDNQIVNPDKGTPAFGDEGGNTLLVLLTGAPPTSHNSLHSFWDTPAVLGALAKIKKDGALGDTADAAAVAAYLAKTPPPGWEIPSSVPLDKTGEYLADAILPLAKTAHERLDFQGLQQKDQHGEVVESGFAREKKMPDGVSYPDWAAGVTAAELAKGGWQLAEVVGRAFAPPAPAPAPAK